MTARNLSQPIVIVGAGMAGGVAAKTLRDEGYSGHVMLIGPEPTVPFGRPPLSKTYLRGEEELTGWLVRPESWYPGNDVELVAASVTRIDTAAHRVETDMGATYAYSSLLLTTGGVNRRLEVPGADLSGVLQLRTVADSDAIKKAAWPGGTAVVVGMGFIGCEVAASLRQLGLNVHAVFPGTAPLASVLGPEMGELMAGIHRDGGVNLVPHDTVVSFEGAGRVQRVITRGGRSLECDLAVVAVGIAPEVEFIRPSGIALDNGVMVDPSCRTNMPDVYAAGDMANHLHPLFGPVRVEHYNNAEKQGAAAARSMLGSHEPYAYIHTFWSDQYEHKLEYAGHVREWDRFVTRGSVTDRKLVGFYLHRGVLRAAVGFDRGGDPELEEGSEMAKASRLIAREARPTAEALADESIDLAQL